MKRICLLCCAVMLLCGQAAFGAALSPDDFESKSVVLMEPTGGKVLFEKNMHEQLPIASVTKTMVLLITMEEIDSGKLALTDMVTGSQHAKDAGGSTIFLNVGEQMSVEDIIKGIIINSGNDAAIAMAERIAGTESEFVGLMNKRAAELQMRNTHFLNATGLDMEGHFSSAYDVALLSRELMGKHPSIKKYSMIWTDTLRGGKTLLANTNKLLKNYEYTTGLKTGYTENAGNCLAATAEKDGMPLIAVVLGAKSGDVRFTEPKKLFEYGYGNFAMKNMAKMGDVVGEVKVTRGGKKTVKAVVGTDLVVVVNKTAGETTSTAILDEFVKAPVLRGTKIGTLSVKTGNEETCYADIVAGEDVGKIGFFKAFWQMLRLWTKF